MSTPLSARSEALFDEILTYIDGLRPRTLPPRSGELQKYSGLSTKKPCLASAEVRFASMKRMAHRLFISEISPTKAEDYRAMSR
jgi:hypothetical protein